MKKRPVIIGAGPAGMFAALALSENGCAPILLEQGDAVEERTKRVEDFWKNGDEALDIRSNVQFGEGGAGTFSDGKLNTLVKDTSEETGSSLHVCGDGSRSFDPLRPCPTYRNRCAAGCG